MEQLLLTSSSKHKRDAIATVSDALLPPFTYEISTLTFPAELKRKYRANAQPLDNEATHLAFERITMAQEVLTPHGVRSKFRVISIESGLFRKYEHTDIRYFDRAVVIVWSPAHQVYVVRRSEPVEIPSKYVEAARALPGGLQENTVGDVIAAETGCDPGDPQSYLTNGRLPRRLQIQRTLYKAFAHSLVLQ